MPLYEHQVFKAIHYASQSLKDYAFIDCQFENCHFVESDWQQAQFTDCLFKNCHLTLVKVEGCRLHHVQFKECKLSGIEFFRCERKFFSIQLEQSLVQSCNFTELNMKKATFQGCKLRDVHFSHMDLTEANFTDTDLQGTLFHQCNLSKANFTHAKNYLIDLQTNQVKQAKFSFPEVVNLLTSFDIQIIDFK